MLASTSSTVKVVAIGITSLGKIQHKELLEDVKVCTSCVMKHKVEVEEA